MIERLDGFTESEGVAPQALSAGRPSQATRGVFHRLDDKLQLGRGLHFSDGYLVDSGRWARGQFVTATVFDGSAAPTIVS